MVWVCRTILADRKRVPAAPVIVRDIDAENFAGRKIYQFINFAGKDHIILFRFAFGRNIVNDELIILIFQRVRNLLFRRQAFFDENYSFINEIVFFEIGATNL